MVVFTMPIFAINGTLPSAPSSLAEWSETQVGARIGFIDNSDNEDGFKAYVSLSGSEENIAVVSMESVPNKGDYQYKTLTGLSCSSLYTVNVVAYNDYGESNKIHVDFETKPCTIVADDPYMMPYYTGKIIPTPRVVEYKNKNISLANTAIILNEIEEGDPRLKYLLERITRYGGKYEFVEVANAEHTCIIKINDERLNAPQAQDYPQGYVISSNGNTISIKGSDFQGLLWAISSLNQMISNKDGKSFVSAVNVTDYPESLHRGFLAKAEISKDPKVISHFMVAYKLNLVDFRAEIAGDKEHHDDWRLPRTDAFKKRVKGLGERLTPLGFDWYAGARFLGCGSIPQINISKGEDFNIIYNNFAEPIAKAGGYLSVQFDDTRFQLHEDDKVTFGTAAKADKKLITSLYNNLTNINPNIRIAFTPPFYWGPIAPDVYLYESRDAYLNMVGTLPNAIDVYWTGPRVRSSVVLPEHVRWEVDRIKRKPLVFQNGIGSPHAFGYHYITDPLESLNKWYYKGYLKDDIKTYMLNGGNFNTSGALVSIADWTWNPKKFNAKSSIKEGVKKLTGVDAYPILENINKELSKFDDYLGVITFKAILNSDLFLTPIINLRALNTKLNNLKNGKSIEFWTNINAFYINKVETFARRVYTISKKDPIINQIKDRDDVSEAMYFAIKDTKEEDNLNYNLDDDILIKPADFDGGLKSIYGYSKGNISLEERPTAYITGKGTGYSQMNATFKVGKDSLLGMYQLIISGADDFLEAKCPIKITLNNNVIFKGKNPFSNQKWNIQTAKIPASYLNTNNEENVLSISNTSPEGNFDAPPAFMLNYVVLSGLK